MERAIVINNNDEYLILKKCLFLEVFKIFVYNYNKILHHNLWLCYKLIDNSQYIKNIVITLYKVLLF